MRRAVSFQRLFADRFKAMNRVSVDTAGRPPSVDALARELAIRHSLPHAVLVDIARRAIANGSTADVKKNCRRTRQRISTKFVARCCQRDWCFIAYEPRSSASRCANNKPSVES